MKQFTFIVLHGWGLSAGKFQRLAEVLKKRGHRVFVPDLPGFGLSENPPDKPLVLSDYVGFLHTYIKQKKIDNPILLGHSFGGRIALKYQFVYPKKVGALILTGTPGVTPVAKKKIFVFVFFAKLGKFLFSVPPFSFVKEKVRAWYYYIAGARDYYRATPVMRETFKNIVQENLTQYMKGIHVPCALIWGGEDIITPVWIARRMGEIIPFARVVVIPETDHGVSYKKPELFAKEVNTFVETV